MLMHPGDEIGFVHGASYTRRFSAVFKQRQGGNAADVHLRREVLFHFGVYFHQSNMRLQLPGGFSEYGSHHFAGPAP